MLEHEPTLLAGGLMLLPAYAPCAELLGDIARITAHAPLRHMQVPGGKKMSVAISNCGAWGWTSDTRGYRYSATDPLTQQPWPALPQAWLALAERAALQAGFAGFKPDACLINSYAAGAQMGLHQDRDEADMRWPIVSVSLGATATFLWGGAQRRDKVHRLPLHHGDVLVWGGTARLNYHGVAPIVGADTQVNAQTIANASLAPNTARFNLTFRKAGP
jgi:DNA oxidative demethylase